jgi:hypothetical protein
VHRANHPSWRPAFHAALVPLLVAALAPWLAAPARAGLKLDAWEGHAAVGMAQLFIDEKPGGSISFGGGVDYPLDPDWRVGLDVSQHLLGGITAESGSLFANVDYSLFEADVRLHWLPKHLGPLRRVSFGPGLMHARAEISSAAGGFAFDSLSVGETAPGVAIDAAWLPARPHPVRVGFEVGARHAFLKKDDWTILLARLAFYY